MQVRYVQTAVLIFVRHVKSLTPVHTHTDPNKHFTGWPTQFSKCRATGVGDVWALT